MRKHVLLAGLTALLCATATAGHAQNVQQLMSEHQALEMRAKQCQYLMNRHLQQMQYAAMHGAMMPMQQPMCMNDQPRIIAQMAYIETLIGRAHGDTRPACQINGTCNLTPYQPQPTPHHGDPDLSNGAVDQIVRGYETTGQGNEMQIGPGGPHHFDCGPGVRNVTGPSYMLPAPNCIER